MVADESLFDAAWEQWRRDLTEALTPISGDSTAAHTWQALQEAGALDPADGRIRREWALNLMTGQDAYRRPLLASGLRDDDVRALIALVQRHPAPAAGG